MRHPVRHFVDVAALATLWMATDARADPTSDAVIAMLRVGMTESEVVKLMIGAPPGDYSAESRSHLRCGDCP
jgi:hypothetical protein